MKSWFTIKAVASGTDTADISIHDEIGVWGVSARQFIDQFKAIDAPKVVLSLNSPGGSVMDALAIFTTLRASGKHVTVKVIGIAASAASYLMLAGDHVTMPANTFAMLHNPLAGAYGHADDLRDMAEVLDKLGASLRATYVKRTGKSDDEIAALLSKDTWLTAQECLDLGLCDEVTPELKIVAGYDVENLPTHIQALFKPPAAPIDPPAVPSVSRLSTAQIQSALADAQLADYTEGFALDAALTTVEALHAAIADASEIVALCAICQRPNDAAGFIQARKPLADVRAALIEARAAKDQHIDTTRREVSASSPPIKNTGAESHPVKRHLDFWARRNQSHASASAR